MIKTLNRNDIQITPFIAVKTWHLQNLDNDDLILWMSGSLSGSISHIYYEYGDGTEDRYVNQSCSLAVQQQNLDVSYHRGVEMTGTFFPVSDSQYNETTNPVNLDGSYMRLVYNTNKQLFYNVYGDPTKIFGLEDINLNNSTRVLSGVMDEFTIPKSKFGDKIVPSSVSLRDSFGGDNYTITDDGETNLILSGSYFSTYQTLTP